MRNCLALALLWSISVVALAQAVTPQFPNSDVLGAHNMGPNGQSPTVGGLPPCLFCHAPHGSTINSQAPAAPGMWSQQLSRVQNYTLYSSATLVNTPQQPVLGRSTSLCLSCHDGTVAPGTTAPYGRIRMSGQMNSIDILGQDLSGVHPLNFKLPLQAAPNLLPLLTVSQPGTTLNPAVRLIDGNVQCDTCHNPHVQGIDSSNQFLVMDNSQSGLCLACHVSSPGTPLSMTSKAKPVAGINQSTSDRNTTQTYTGLTAWRNSAHFQAGNQISKSAHIGPYATVRRNGCLSCHSTHKGQTGGALLAASVAQTAPNLDATSQSCLSCHNGGSNLSPAISNIYQEFAKVGHPFPSGTNTHLMNESAVLNKNRHATCVDCHEPHASEPTRSFVSVSIRASQSGAEGVSITDGATVVKPALNQYEVCLRCHGTSTGKQTLSMYGYSPQRLLSIGDPLNLVPLLSQSAGSSHPVAHDRNSTFSQPSLLKFMLNLDGHTQGRPVGVRLLCTDCHNSDDNREFGGSGPNGPHGSQYSHILERRYEFSQVAPGLSRTSGPGSTIVNLLPPVVDPTANGPYSLCAKCHDLSNIMSNASFNKHSTHINAGFSCSVCHAAHGVPQGSSPSGGLRLVNFDVKVVAQNDSQNLPVAYNRATGTCTLKCHSYNHNLNGAVTASQGASTGRLVK